MYRTPYSIEYKKQAVDLSKQVGVMKAAKTLGIPENLIYRWARNTNVVGVPESAPTPTPTASGCSDCGDCVRMNAVKRDLAQTRAEADAFETLWRSARR